MFMYISQMALPIELRYSERYQTKTNFAEYQTNIAILLLDIDLKLTYMTLDFR